MSQNYLGEIRAVGFTYAPQGWLTCQGQLIAISDNAALYNLLGTSFGGDGVNTFGLPDLRGRAILGMGNSGGTNYPYASVAGQETVTLTPTQLAAHSHPIAAQSTPGNAHSPSGQTFAQSTVQQFDTTPAVAFSGNMLTPTGGSQPHENRMPFLTLNFIIATEGIYPSQS